jgi:hypothetical protein
MSFLSRIKWKKCINFDCSNKSVRDLRKKGVRNTLENISRTFEEKKALFSPGRYPHLCFQQAYVASAFSRQDSWAPFTSSLGLTSPSLLNIIIPQSHGLQQPGGGG